MRAIENLKNLQNLLNSKDPSWQEKLYDQTGVIAILRGDSAILLSNCGYIDLDADAEYRYVRGEDLTQYCTITSTDELAEYICQMESYHEFLVDQSFGRFTKAELFWAVHSQIVDADENTIRKNGEKIQDWGLYRISTYFHKLKNENEITLDMALIDYDACEMWIPWKKGLGLSDCLEHLVAEMNSITEDIDDISVYQVRYEKPIQVPKSYKELIALTQPGNVFDWLN